MRRERQVVPGIRTSRQKKCERCLNGNEARYRVYTDAMEIKVCPGCAEEARRIGIAVEALDVERHEWRKAE